MAAPTRDEALATLEEGRGTLDALFERLGEQELVRTSTIGGGDWSALDLLGHIGTWEELALDALSAWRAGRVPLVEEVFRAAPSVDELNAQRIQSLRRRRPDEVRRWAHDTHEALVAEITAMSDEEWTSKAPYPAERRDRLVTLLGSVLGAPQRPFGHPFAHQPDLQAYVDEVRGA
ncbi:MAG TPA: DinB family protein [Actinomycetota bacterium]